MFFHITVAILFLFVIALGVYQFVCVFSFFLLLSFLSNHLFIFCLFYLFECCCFFGWGVVCLRVEGQLTLCAPYPPKNI